MIKKLKIENFKSIKDEIELSFEPAVKDEIDEYYLKSFKNEEILKLALIYGPNASGKTNIIKALEFVRDFILNPLISKDKKIDIKPFIFCDNIEKNSKFYIEFFNDDYFFIYELILNRDEVVKEILYAKKEKKKYLVFKRENDEEIKYGSKIKLKKDEKNIIKLNTLPNNSIFSGYGKTNIEEIEELQIAYNWFKKLLPPIYPFTYLLDFVIDTVNKNNIKKEEIIDILKKADFAIDNYEIVEKDIDDEFKKLLISINKEDDIDNFKKIELFFTHFNKYQIEFDEESRGTQRFYQLAVVLTLLRKKSLVLSIDEIESSLHPDLLKYFLLSFLVNSENSQLILTTHSRELLIEKDILRKDIIWFTEKRDDGSTDLFSLSDFGSEIRENSSIYNAYKLGKLGANPNLKDYFFKA